MNKRILPLLIALLCLSISNLMAQAPQLINYQAVVRNNAGQPVASGTPVSLRFTIHDASSTGTVAFQEIQNDTANQFGLVTVQIGSVTSLTTVDWGLNSKYLQVELALNNSGNYTDMGTSQLLSVPYALFAGNV